MAPVSTRASIDGSVSSRDGGGADRAGDGELGAENVFLVLLLDHLVAAIAFLECFDLALEVLQLLLVFRLFVGQVFPVCSVSEHMLA